ncbi:MAG: lytic transglycosylase domain-containing protein [Armatimonadetes bacterium]|nr:lytic transglycosylase domain-containing protein [Armatimonadota bacterium]
MNLEARGIHGAMQRRQELQSRIDLLSQRKREITTSVANGIVPRPMPGKAISGDYRPFDPLGANVARQPFSAPSNLRSLIAAAAQKAGIDPSLFEALISQESSFDRFAESSAGALGLSQLMPKTAEMLGVTDVWNPEQNLSAGARYLAQMLRDFDGDERLALAAYNSGPGTVRFAGGMPDIPETQRYVIEVLARAEALRKR